MTGSSRVSWSVLCLAASMGIAGCTTEPDADAVSLVYGSRGDNEIEPCG